MKEEKDKMHKKYTNVLMAKRQLCLKVSVYEIDRMSQTRVPDLCCRGHVPNQSNSIHIIILTDLTCMSKLQHI